MTDTRNTLNAPHQTFVPLNTLDSPETENETWSEIIRPKRNVFDFKLRELWQYRDLIWLFVKRDFVSQYKQTILGPAWFFFSSTLQHVIFRFCFLPSRSNIN